ncbi:hypothetical protein LOTGIDRAFT_164612 [Lottia gigantea]|uniref:Uncharacterized protein n=1 Tax=Lottia gigantea TaxID=225164 RepID=V3ZZV9_LOTGI|nr:hypothetical protein LOTGIDRAFT_164612 [Lottia gigantea]ESO89917.1 hypothetical protein LOTGIDRAFT_164612 [Lottia gigantea]
MLLGYFIAEIKNEKGDDYKPNTLYEIIISIQYYMRQNGRFLSMMDDGDFRGMKVVLYAKMKDLNRQGKCVQRRQVDIINEKHENMMWNNGILGSNSPQQLLDTLVFQLGLHFALRAGQEHRNLRTGALSQLTVKLDNQDLKYLDYHEDVSKTNEGGLQHRKMTPKITRAYENKEYPERCPVKMYEKYMSLRPKNGKVTRSI